VFGFRKENGYFMMNEWHVYHAVCMLYLENEEEGFFDSHHINLSDMAWHI